MFKKDNIKFYVGAAVGVTVGLCIGKLLSANAFGNVENAQRCQIVGSVSECDNLSIKKHECCTRARSVSWYRDKDQEDSTFLMAPIKLALSDSNININSAMPVKEMEMNKISSLCEPHRIVSKEGNLSQSRVAYFLNESCSDNLEAEQVYEPMFHTFETIPNNLALRSDSLDKKINNIPGCASVENPVDSFNNSTSSLNDSHVATCNTIVDVKRANLTSALNDYEFSDTEYNEFSECNVISSTKYDSSIPF